MNREEIATTLYFFIKSGRKNVFFFLQKQGISFMECSEATCYMLVQEGYKSL
jgi:hypothetical protein